MNRQVKYRLFHIFPAPLLRLPTISCLRFTGGGPAPTGCTKALLSPAALAFATDIAADELAHVTFLRSALINVFNSTPVAQPQIDLSAAFTAAGNAAFGAVLSPSFSPYGSDVLFYLGSYIFEDVGATACECEVYTYVCVQPQPN